MAASVKSGITPRAAALLAAIRARGDWISRAELARATGKNQLSPHDWALLERLIAAGLIDVRVETVGRTNNTMYEYKAKER